MVTYTLRDAARILKVSPKRLRHWERTVLSRLRTTLEEGEGPDPSGFEFRDLVGARAVLGLIDQGISLRRIRASVEVLRDRMPEVDDPLGSLRLWAEGSPRVVVDHDGKLLEPGGQLMLDFRGDGGEASEVADLASLRDAAAIHELTALEWFERGCSLDADPSTYERAEAAYRHAIEIDPTFGDAHCNLGAVLYNRGQRGAARRCFERCLELEPGHVEANFNLANLLEEDGADEIALGHYRKALRSDPMYPDLHVNLALLYERLGSPAQSRQHWQRYLKLEPSGTWAEVARGRLEQGEES